MLCRGGTLYAQGDLGAVKVTTADEGGTYLGSSAHYPGSMASVDVQMRGSGNLIIATSSSVLTHLQLHPYGPMTWFFPVSRITGIH